MPKCNWPCPSEMGFILKNSVQDAQAEAELEPKFTPFAGIGRRLDGKPSKHQAPTVSSPAKGQQSETTNDVKKTASTSESSSSRETMRKLVFGSNANRTSKEAQVCNIFKLMYQCGSNFLLLFLRYRLLQISYLSYHGIIT